MGQEASVPRNVSDEAAAYHQQPPSLSPPQDASASSAGARPTTASVGNNVANANAILSDINLPVNDATLPSRVIHAERPQSQQQLRQQTPPQPQHQHQLAAQAIVGKSTILPSRSTQHAAPSPRLSPSQQQGGSASATTSIMSRAGLSSMIQRMGGVGSAGSRSVPNSPSRRVSRNVGSSHGTVKQNSSQIQQREQVQQHQEQIVSRADNVHNNSVHHQELSPDSKARQQAEMMRKQQQESQRLKLQQNPSFEAAAQQSSLSYNGTTADSESSKTMLNMMYTEGHTSTSSNAITVPTPDIFGSNMDSGESALSTTPSLVQGMTNLNLSPQQPSSRSQARPPTQQNKSPPSPRAISLRQMQHNDEEDWEKAWAEDSEDSDEEDDGVVNANNSNKITATAAITGGSIDDSMLPVVPDLSTGDAKGRVEGDESIIPPPDVDSGDSSMSLAQNIVAPPTLAMQSAFPPTKPQYPMENNIQQRDQGNELLPVMTKSPSIQQSALPNEIIDEETRLTLEANEALQRGDENGQQYNWDMCNREGVIIEKEDERPCVKMFDPALRVLGRGSFGRVSQPIVSFLLDITNHNVYSLTGPFTTKPLSFTPVPNNRLYSYKNSTAKDLVYYMQ